MTDRDRLIELLKNAFEFYIDDPYCIPDEADFADDLLANGVVKVVRCKDCKYSRPRKKDERHIYFEGVLICESCLMADEPYVVWEDDFCSYGELKERER